MHKIIIFGNSGSGKSTLAKEYSFAYGIPLLELDTVAWEDTSPPVRKSLNKSEVDIHLFTDKNENWVIEGGYSDLIGLVINTANKLVFLNPGIEVCIRNCKNRPWEPHKYDSEEKQNKNLSMLLDWVKKYSIRKDEFSLFSHQNLFNSFSGNKIEYNSNKRN